MEHDTRPASLRRERKRSAPSAGSGKNWQRRRAERLERERLERQLAIARETPDLVATADIDGFLTSLNAAGRRLLGLAEGAPIAHLRLEQLYTEDCARQLTRTEIPAAVSGQVRHAEITLRGAGGDEIPCSQNLIAHRDGDGNLAFFSLILRDLRPIRLAEDERRQLLEQLHQARKMETIGRLAGGIAHDFNNILTVIVGYAELALADLPRDASLRGDLEIILNAAQQGARLSNQLRDFSSKQAFEPHVLDLNESIEGAGKLLKSLIGEEIEIRTLLAERLFPVRMDRSQLEQVIMNLAVNARDAMPAGGQLVFRTANLALSGREAVRRGLREAGEYALLSVSDTGTGIDAADLEHIFEPFFTTKEYGKGAGLGLASVYSIVRQGGGSVQVRSRKGQGSTFDIYLPHAGEERAGDAPDAGLERSELPRGSEKILLVEDNEEIRALLSKVLLELGYSLYQTTNGRHALELYREHGKDIGLVISDVVMPQMDGLGLRRELLAFDPAARVLLISGHTDRIAALRKLGDPGLRLLCKPFTPARLLREMRRLLDEKEPA